MVSFAPVNFGGQLYSSQHPFLLPLSVGQGPGRTVVLNSQPSSQAV